MSFGIEDDYDSTTHIKPVEFDENKPSRPKACLLVLAGPTTGQTVYLEAKDNWTIGRSTENDLVMPDTSVSRMHCRVGFRQPDQWILEDLNSSNGTFVNNDRLTGTTVLRRDDKIQLGSGVTIKFVFQDELEAALQSQLYESATKDSLTNLYSKRHFIEQLEIEYNFHRRTKKPLSIIMGDLDHFKKINDTYGHLAGDAVLKESGRLLLNVLRKGDLGGRYGGEEMIFMLRETPLPGAKIFAERIRKIVESHPFIYEGKKIPVTISMGICSFSQENYNSIQEMIKVADEFLYKAKQGGRNKVCCLSD